MKGSYYAYILGLAFTCYQNVTSGNTVWAALCLTEDDFIHSRDISLKAGTIFNIVQFMWDVKEVVEACSLAAAWTLQNTPSFNGSCNTQVEVLAPDVLPCSHHSV